MKLKGLVLDILDRYVNNHKFQIVNIIKPRLGDAYACSIFEKQSSESFSARVMSR
jgi:hypothetical protein